MPPMTDSDSARYDGVWIVAEQSGGRVQRVAHELLTRARDLADKRRTDLTAIVIGHKPADSDLHELIERGADEVVVMDDPVLERFLLEPYAACLLHAIRERRPEIVLAAATSQGRTLMPYVAVKARTGLTADCTLLDIEPETGNLLQTRPAIGGNILATIKTPHHRPQMATVRPRSAPPAPRRRDRTGRVTRLRPPDRGLGSRIEYLEFLRNEDEHPLQEADIVVSAGRGVKKGENVALVERLARALGAALGASRDVVDRGWLSYPHQVGLSGKTVSPRLYVAVGISGAIQHVAGMQTAETIIAINSDPDAPIFNVADIGIVGDLFEVVPVLVDAIRNARESR